MNPYNVLRFCVYFLLVLIPSTAHKGQKLINPVTIAITATTVAMIPAMPVKGMKNLAANAIMAITNLTILSVDPIFFFISIFFYCE